MSIKNKIKIGLINYKKIVVWGSGGLARTAIKYWLPKDKIDYVIDSNFNKNNYFPYEVFNTEKIEKSKPELIIVCSSAYVEIFEKIKKINPNIKFKYIYELFLINHDFNSEISNLMIDIAATKNSNFFKLILKKPQILVNITYRLSKYFKKKKFTFPLYYFLAPVHYLFCLLTSIQLPLRLEAGPGLIIAHPGTIIFSEKAKLGSFVTIYHCCTVGTTLSGGSPVIKDFVTIYSGSHVLGSSLIGKHSKVGAMSLVLDFQCGDFMTIAGIPASIKKKYNI